MRPTRLAPATALAFTLAAGVAACGGGAGGPPTLKYYSALDGAGTNVAQAKICSRQSGGKYTIEVVPLANSADASRELLVRRLAAKDSDIDMINMDTIWTPEFAAAGWLKQMTGADRAAVTAGQLAGPLKSVEWKGKVYAVPLNTNAQLLWYRKDLVPNPPRTWAQMIQMAKQLPAKNGLIEEQGQKYEGYVVWFNNLVASDGGTIVNAQGKPTLGPAAVKAAQIIKDVATSGRADPALSTSQEDQGRLQFEAGRAAFELNWPYVYAAGRADAKTNPVTRHVMQNMGWAPYPRVDPSKPARVSIGGANIGVSVYGKHPDFATKAALCMASRRVQQLEAINEGLPPTFNSLYDDPKVRAAYPFANMLRNELKVAVPRPETPIYSDVTLAVQDSLHPPASINPVQSINTLRSRLNTVLNGGMY